MIVLLVLFLTVVSIDSQPAPRVTPLHSTFLPFFRMPFFRSSGCPIHSIRYKTNCYYVGLVRVTPSRAAAMCRAIGGKLFAPVEQDTLYIVKAALIELWVPHGYYMGSQTHDLLASPEGSGDMIHYGPIDFYQPYWADKFLISNHPEAPFSYGCDFLLTKDYLTAGTGKCQDKGWQKFNRVICSKLADGIYGDCQGEGWFKLRDFCFLVVEKSIDVDWATAQEVNDNICAKADREENKGTLFAVYDVRRFLAVRDFIFRHSYDWSKATLLDITPGGGPSVPVWTGFYSLRKENTSDEYHWVTPLEMLDANFTDLKVTKSTPRGFDAMYIDTYGDLKPAGADSEHSNGFVCSLEISSPLAFSAPDSIVTAHRWGRRPISRMAMIFAFMWMLIFCIFCICFLAILFIYYFRKLQPFRDCKIVCFVPTANMIPVCKPCKPESTCNRQLPLYARSDFI